jgi:hypothetical protein
MLLWLLLMSARHVFLIPSMSIKDCTIVWPLVEIEGTKHIIGA